LVSKAYTGNNWIKKQIDNCCISDYQTARVYWDIQKQIVSIFGVLAKLSVNRTIDKSAYTQSSVEEKHWDKRYCYLRVHLFWKSWIQVKALSKAGDLLR